MSGKNQWVVPVNGGEQWGVRGEGNDRLTSVHHTQQQAIDRMRAANPTLTAPCGRG